MRKSLMGKVVAGVLASALLLTGCAGGNGGSDGGEEKETVRAALNGEPSTLDPIKEIYVAALSAFRSIFTGLTELNAEGEVEGTLATSWEANADATEWTFDIRTDAKFHDDTPITAEDVVFSYETGMNDPEAGVASYVSMIEKVEAVSENQVKFTMNRPFAAFDRQVTLISIIPKAAYEADPEGFGKNPVGSGRYKFESWQRGDVLKLVRNDDYFGDDGGSYAKLEYRFIEDEPTRANALQSGDIDVAEIGASSLDAVDSASNVSVVERESGRTIYVGMNVTTGALGDEKVREAIDLAFDREGIKKAVYQDYVELNGQIIAPLTFGYNPDIKPTEQDIEKAKQLIDDSSYDGSPIVFNFPAAGELPQSVQVAEALAANLKEIGLNIELNQHERGNFSNAWLGKELEGLYVYQFAPSILDADIVLALLGKSQAYYDDPEMDQLIQAQAAATDPDERAKLIGEAMAVLNDKHYYSGLFTDKYKYGVNDNVDWTPRADGYILFTAGS